MHEAVTRQAETRVQVFALLKRLNDCASKLTSDLAQNSNVLMLLGRNIRKKALLHA
jgi:hypothetical protein